jgi:AraC-like DNA-binding protein
MAALFTEISGVLLPEPGAPVGQDGKVVLSNLRSGGSGSRGQATCGIKYVADGVEIYRYGGKSFVVEAGQFLIVPEQNEGEVEIGRSDSASAIGLCLYLPPPLKPAAERLDAPMLFPAACSALGKALATSAAEMLRRKPAREAIARNLLGRVANDIEPLIEDTVRLLDGIDAMKPATRYETLRRLNVARAYLHSVTDRTVELAELARVAGISRYQLLRSFRDAFGAPPAAYHRTVRLELARDVIERRLLGCGEAAHRYGFADCSSFSHAYRRAFGRSPIRSLTPST